MNWNYIKRNKKLNNEELITKAKSGDNEAKELLFKNNIPSIYKIVRRWKKMGCNIETEELISIGCLGMQKAYNFYDPTKGFKFTTLLYTAINNEIKYHVRATKLNKRDYYHIISLDKPHEDGDTLYNIVSDTNIIDPFSLTNSIFLRNLLIKFYETATEREKIIIHKIYYEGISGRELSDELGITHQRVSQIHKKILEKLKCMTEESA
ncbi:sigma-70 family RNA polymerase sigma factor [Paenibacillus naphthalenovorans]|uniref:Sigma-70 family RNA polymerase sigma factor n=1 Tax=Paenibacillus naphthalenovorans TaxID=162209 RepID=A0A0U2U7E9_9BACL|nr:sigma-70 family RNA polymerase sigma factor [Paenibacillus naphthalenovorans]ALS22104.1 sigma-70 family RNA polymerase sigma factor [Paenibacillus naphthalenovorans]